MRLCNATDRCSKLKFCTGWSVSTAVHVLAPNVKARLKLISNILAMSQLMARKIPDYCTLWFNTGFFCWILYPDLDVSFHPFSGIGSKSLTRDTSLAPRTNKKQHEHEHEFARPRTRTRTNVTFTNTNRARALILDHTRLQSTCCVKGDSWLLSELRKRVLFGFSRWISR